jgi:tetratricopeptide (TPR) repeat protein
MVVRLIAVLLICLFHIGPAALTQSSVGGTSLAAAARLYQSGQFAAAEAAYAAILKTDARLVPAQTGLIRSLLREQKIEEASEAARRSLEAQPESPSLLVAMGEVQFRRAEMPEAEKSYLKALKIDSSEVYADLGLARLYRAYSLYRHAYDALTRAHDLAPDNPDVQRLYFNQLPRKRRIAAMEAYLAVPHPDDPVETERLKGYLEFLRATADTPVHACKLVSKVEQAETKLETLYADAHRVRGVGLAVKLNGHSNRLLLDTGASGILIGRKSADKAGVIRLSSQHFTGIGDQGVRGGYTAVLDSIRIGELEFHDCIVRVADKGSITDEDGLIGADVLGSYLIDIDIPGQKLRLSPLPRRPEEKAAPTALHTDADAASNADDKSGSEAAIGASAHRKPAEAPSASPSASTEAGAVTNATSAIAATPLPKDRYVSPEMSNWTRIFRFGHQLLIPTYVNDSKAMLFLIDTGSYPNMLSTRAARQVTRVEDSRLQVHGISGSVGRVYSGEKAALMFSHFRQNNQDIVTIDLDRMCQSTGTEVSGVLGFDVLRLLEVKIDYRDGLVDFVHPNIPPPKN